MIVREVIPETAAYNAGVQPDDLLLEINNERINSREEFIILVSSLKPGDEVKILLDRNGSELSVKASLGTRPKSEK